MQSLLKWIRRSLLAAGLVLATVVVIRAFDARRLPDLRVWHRVSPRSEVRARDMTADFTLADYLRREDATIEEARRNVESGLRPEDRTRANRYFAGGPLNPYRFPRNWNRTFELVPERVRAGALLIHGLTDSPYSMRGIARVLRESGIYVLCPRMPGHGTVPGALTDVAWEDWMGAVRVGARAVRARIGPAKPFYVVGYSSGGALTVRYALDSLDDPALPRPDRLVLFSPMIGVTRFAGLATTVGALGFLPYFEKSRWIEVAPEYNPFKYNSFPANAAQQTFRLTRSVDAGLERAASGAIRKMPPILAFQSLVDTTVSTDAVVHRLFDRLPAGTSELVIFDRNRDADLRTLQPAGSEEAMARLLPKGVRRYAVTIVTNAAPETAEVVARTTRAGESADRSEPLGLSWPAQTFSLSHIALPFAVDDPLYGAQPDLREFYGVRLGVIAPHGERNGLIVGMDQLMRLTCNPFFPYVERRLREWLKD